MKTCYPIILTPLEENDGYLVHVPDFDIDTHGKNLSDALDMAKDAIELCGVSIEDSGEPLPTPSDYRSIECEPSEMILAVNADFASYRRMLDNRSVKKNCTIPSWLNEKAEAANINFSAVLQEALKAKLQLI